MMHKLYGYNCHKDDKHITEHDVGIEDMNNILNFVNEFSVTIPKVIRHLLKTAKTGAECHSAAHEFSDWMMTAFIAGKGEKAFKEMCVMTFGKGDAGIENAKSKLQKMRSTCKI